MSKKMKTKFDLDSIKAELEAERDATLAESKPLHKQREALLKKIQPLEAQLRQINDKITAIEQPILTEVGKQISVLHQAISPNQRTLKAES